MYKSWKLHFGRSMCILTTWWVDSGLEMVRFVSARHSSCLPESNYNISSRYPRASHDPQPPSISIVYESRECLLINVQLVFAITSCRGSGSIDLMSHTRTMTFTTPNFGCVWKQEMFSVTHTFVQQCAIDLCNYQMQVKWFPSSLYDTWELWPTTTFNFNNAWKQAIYDVTQTSVESNVHLISAITKCRWRGSHLRRTTDILIPLDSQWHVHIVLLDEKIPRHQ